MGQDQVKPRLTVLLAVGICCAVPLPVLAQPASQPTEPQKRRTDSYGDPLPPRALGRLGTTRFRQGGAVTHLVFSRDANTLLSASGGGIIREWAVRTGKLIREFPGRVGDVMVIGYGKGGHSVVAVGRGGMVNVWDRESGKQFKQDKGRGGDGAVSLSANGATVAVGGHGPVVLWDVAKGIEASRLATRGKRVVGLAFSPDSKLLALRFADAGIEVVELEKKKRVSISKGNFAAPRDEPNRRYQIAFSTNGNVLAAHGRADSITVWRDWAAKGKARKTEVDTGYRAPFVLSPDGRQLIVAKDGGALVLWSLDKAKREGKLFGSHAPNVKSLALSLDGRILASGAIDGVIRLWDLPLGKQRTTRDGHTGVLSSIAFTSNGKTVLTSSWDQTVRSWDLPADRARWRTTRFGSAVVGIKVPPDAKFLIASTLDGTIHVRPLGRQKEWSLRTDNDCPRSLALSSDGKQFAVGCESGKVRVGSLSTQKWVWTVAGHQYGVTDLTFSQSGKLLASGSRDGFIRLWRVPTGDEVPCVIRHPAEIRSLAFSPTSEDLLVSAGYSGFRCWDIVRGKLLNQSAVEESMLEALVFTSDGRSFATSGPDGCISLWELSTARRRLSFRGHRGRVSTLAFCPGDKVLASGGADTTALLWDLTSAAQDRAMGNGGKIGKAALGKHWAALLDVDGEKAYAAMCAMIASPEESIAFLNTHARPYIIERSQVTSLIKALDSDDFATREKALSELRRIGKLAEPFFRVALKGPVSVHVKSQLRDLVKESEKKIPTGEYLRLLRTIEILERIGGGRGSRLLTLLSKGPAANPIAEEARKVLLRMRHK
jgi:WD40 repeat protein